MKGRPAIRHVWVDMAKACSPMGYSPEAELVAAAVAAVTQPDHSSVSWVPAPCADRPGYLSLVAVRLTPAERFFVGTVAHAVAEMC